MKSGFRYFCFICASLLATQVFAADMSGWSDKTVCRLVKAGGGQEHIEEAANRGLACITNSVASNNSKTHKKQVDVTKISINTGSSSAFPNCEEIYISSLSNGDYKNCRILVKLDQKSEFKVQGGNLWRDPSLLGVRDKGEGVLNIIGYTWDQLFKPRTPFKEAGNAHYFSALVNLNDLSNTDNGAYTVNPTNTIRVSTRWQYLVDVDGNGTKELVLAANREDGRATPNNMSSGKWNSGIDQYYSEYNYFIDFDKEEKTKFSGNFFTHDFSVTDLDDDGYMEFIDIPYNKKSGRFGANVCSAKNPASCKWSFLPSEIEIIKSSVTGYPDETGGQMVAFCYPQKGTQAICWYDVKYTASGALKFKRTNVHYIDKSVGNVSYYLLNWLGNTVQHKGASAQGARNVEGVSPKLQIKLPTAHYTSFIADFDDDGDLDTALDYGVRICSKNKNEKSFDVRNCEEKGSMLIFRNDSGTMTLVNNLDIPIKGLNKYELIDINNDGLLDISIHSSSQDWECKAQGMILLNSGNNYRLAKKDDYRNLHGKFGCELSSKYFNNQGKLYRLFYTKKSPKNDEPMYVAIEPVGFSFNEDLSIGYQQKVVEQSQQNIEDELEAEEAKREVDIEAKFVKMRAKVAAAKAKRIAEETAQAPKVAAAKAKRIAEETAQAAKDKLIEDEIAAFEAELAAELSQ